MGKIINSDSNIQIDPNHLPFEGDVTIQENTTNESESHNNTISPEEELALFQSLEKERISLQKMLYRIAFVVHDIPKQFAEIEADSFYTIINFTLTENHKEYTPNELLIAIPEWLDEVKKLRDICNNEFLSKHQISEDNQLKLEKVLRRFPLHFETINDWCEIALSYGQKPEQYSSLLWLLPEQVPDFIQKLNKQVQTINQIKNTLIHYHLRLVISIVKKINYSSISLDELTQEGNIGLMYAIDKFDYHRGYRFSTYATWWVRQTVSKAINEQSRIIHIPGHMISTINKINITEQSYFQENGRNPTIQELSQILELPPERISAIQKMARQCISLQISNNQNENSVLEQIQSNDGNPVDDLSSKILKESISIALDILTEREKQIVVSHFGLDGRTEMSYNEIGKLLGLSGERVRQIEIKAVKKIKLSQCSKILEDYW